MEQAWFEMRDIRRRCIDSAAWIPLRAHETIERGSSGHEGYQEEYFGVGTIAVPISAKLEDQDFHWSNIGISHSHGPDCGKESYDTVECHVFSDAASGTRLVLDQQFNGSEVHEWHLNQDLVIALGLKREGDQWLSPNEAYVQVARLRRDTLGSPCFLEIRAEYLKDYLCARGLRLHIASFRERKEVVPTVEHIKWTNQKDKEESQAELWEGSVRAIHEGGEPFGSEWSTFVVSRTDVDPEVEIPKLSFPKDGDTESTCGTIRAEGRKLFSVRGELWRNEQLSAAERSPRVRGDKSVPTVSFITDSEGKRETGLTLNRESRWLWFRPSVILAILANRGSRLGWYSRDTGVIRCSPDYPIHFGINKIGLINVYAKDIGQLPEWQQLIWAGHNVSPEGGVSAELLAAQMQCNPAGTQAPEAYLQRGLDNLANISHTLLGTSILRRHADASEIAKRCHRFRATDQPGLLALAKDVARITVDDFDMTALRGMIPKADSKLGSIKLVEKLVGQRLSEANARAMLGPLVGIYDLRLADAHLASKETAESLQLAGVDVASPMVVQGCQLIHSCVAVLYQVADVMKQPRNPSGHPNSR